MKSTKILSLLLVVVMCLGMFASCFGGPTGTPGGNGGDGGNGGTTTENPLYKQAEYNTFTSVMPSNWNEFTYSDNNDTQILSYISSSFFDYDYKFDGNKYNEDGSINADAIVSGAYTTNYSAATKLEDVTSTVGAKWGYTDEQKAEGGYAWKITLRNDLKWDDGTPITAADFEYSMKEILNPLFMNMRANTYYDTLRVKNSKNYFYQNQEATYATVGSKGYASNQAALDAGVVLFIDLWKLDNDLFGWGLQAAGLVDAEGNPMPQYLAYNDERLFNTPDGWETGSEDLLFDAATAWQYIAPGAPYSVYCEVGAAYAAWLGIQQINEIRDVKWEDVGMYAIADENAIVICLDKAYSLLNEDGSLALWAAYYMSSLPLVHQAKYEASKTAPVKGATLWTSNYNSSLETTASWGPYKLVKYTAGSDYRLEKNENWYGWNMELYKNQYNITAINCRKVAEWSTQWMGFLNGTYDDASLQTDNFDQYKDSKYLFYAPSSTGTYGMQLFSDLGVLKNSDNNNGILAITEFRQAFNLALNRTDIVEKIWPGSAVPCFGLLSPGYYYDIENAPTLEDGGVYRNSVEAMTGILRAYGFTEENGLWTDGTLENLTLEEAYEALTGYNPILAKAKMKEAIAILEADAEYYGYDATQNITIIYGSSSDTAKQRLRADYLQVVLDDLTVGTSLEDKIDVVFDASAGQQWAEAFRSGATQIGFGYGFTGNAFNPFDIIGAFVNPEDELNYHAYWDTSAIDLTLTLPEGDYTGAGETITMSIQNWFYCLNGLAKEYEQPKEYNFDAGFVPTKTRLTILAALEEVVIKESRSVMLISDYGGSFLGAKFSQFSDEYNTFMGFGGLRYMVVEYTDAEWVQFVKNNNNDLSNEYQKSE